MKRIYDEFEIMMKNRKHLLFLIVLWSIIGLSLFAFGIGLRRTTKASFGYRPDGKTEYTYELEVKDRQVVNTDSLTTRKKLNTLLTENYDYYSFYLTTGTVTKLVNTGLDVNYSKRRAEEAAAEGTSKDEKNTAQNYTVNVIFLDRNAAMKTGFSTEFLRTFDGDLDYDATIPVMCGYGWSGEEYAKDKLGPVIRTDVAEADYETEVIGYVSGPGSEAGEESDTAAMVQFDSRTLNLHNYVIVPLRDQGSSNSLNENANEKDRRTYWCRIYDLRNQGRIISALKADSLQMDINDKLEAAGLSENFTIRIRGANYDSKILYNKKLDSIQSLVDSGSKAALIIAGLMLVLYIFFSVHKNQRFIMVSYINGTGKIEMWFLCLIQLVIWIVSTLAVSYGIYYGVMKLLELDAVTVEEMAKPALIIAGLGVLVMTFKLLLMDAGKKLRRV